MRAKPMLRFFMLGLQDQSAKEPKAKDEFNAEYVVFVYQDAH
jgi:hypothetical protein